MGKRIDLEEEKELTALGKAHSLFRNPSENFGAFTGMGTFVSMK